MGRDGRMGIHDVREDAKPLSSIRPVEVREYGKSQTVGLHSTLPTTCRNIHFD